MGWVYLLVLVQLLACLTMMWVSFRLLRLAEKNNREAHKLLDEIDEKLS